MAMEISQIKNDALRAAAEKADEAGNLDGKLNDNMELFAKEAYKKGCSAEDILSITGEVKDNAFTNTIKNIQAIEAKERELENLVAGLDDKKAKHDEIKTDSNNYNTKVQIGTGIAGGVVGGGAVFGLMYGLSSLINKGKFGLNWYSGIGKGFDKVVSVIFGSGGKLRAAAGLSAICLAAGTLSGIFAGKKVAEETNLFGLKPHEAKVSQKAAEDYRAANIAPDEVKIQQLKTEIEGMKEAFEGPVEL